MVMDNIQAIAFLVSNLIVPLLGVAIAAFAVLAYFRSRAFQLGQITISGINREAEEIRERLDIPAPNDDASARQYALLKEYHAQGLAQSKVSFWFSLIFAALGFSVILVAVGTLIFGGELRATSSVQSTATQPIFALVAGTIIEAVAALFFVQSNKARQLMIDFFDRARLDRKIDESLSLVDRPKDENLSGRLRAYLAMNFADVRPDLPVMRELLGFSARKPLRSNKNRRPVPQ
jgi:hypothetical protein